MIPVPVPVLLPAVVEKMSERTLATSLLPDAIDIIEDKSKLLLVSVLGVNTSPAVRLTSVTMPSAVAFQPVFSESTSAL